MAEELDEAELKNPLGTLLLGLQKVCRDRASAAVEALGGTPEAAEAAAAGSPWPETVSWLAGVVDRATSEYLELSKLRQSAGNGPGVPTMREALMGDKMLPLARLFSVLHTRWVEGVPKPEVTKVLWEAAFEEYAALLLATMPRETPGVERRTYKVANLNDSDTMPRADDRQECAREDSNVVGSLCVDGKHRPVIDIDHPCQLVPSSTPGHHHLYVDVPASWAVYERLLWALADAGIVSVFYARAAAQRQQSFVRQPWVRKETIEPKPAGVEPPDAWQERELEREARAMMRRTRDGIDGLDWDRRRLEVALRIEREESGETVVDEKGT